MTDSPGQYRAIPSSSEDQAYHSDVHEAEGCGDELYSTTERILVEARTKWTYFLLGCTILLPWNGDSLRQTSHLVCAHVHSALLNATSFFLSRLAGSTLYPTFSSYLFSVFTLTKIACQFYCTFTSKQVRGFH
jgi:equilibrative nucleoside transporter 1/2/3